MPSTTPREMLLLEEDLLDVELEIGTEGAGNAGLGPR